LFPPWGHDGIIINALCGGFDVTLIPCPHCGEKIACNEQAIGRKLRCPNCRVMLQLDADAEGRPVYGWQRRRFPLIHVAAALILFLGGLGIGFLWGRITSNTVRNGVSATSVGFFSASNSVVVNGRPVAPQPPSPPAGAANPGQ
jgi:hypothetical protein